jgi:hypothetical protein
MGYRCGKIRARVGITFLGYFDDIDVSKDCVLFMFVMLIFGIDDVILFVVNHLPEEDTVEKFSFDQKTFTLTHIASIKSPAFR